MGVDEPDATLPARGDLSEPPAPSGLPERSTPPELPASPERPGAAARPGRIWGLSGPLDAVGYGVLLVELGLTLGVLAHYARGQWFFFDDWRFLVIEHLGHDTVRTLFLSHNGHWVTLPFLEYRALFTVFGGRSYVPFVSVTIAVHLVVCLLLFALARRGGAGVLEAAACVGVAAFAGVGAENMLWAFQTTFSGAVAFGLGALVVATGGPLTTRRGLAVGGLTLGALMCSGIGLAMLVVVAVATVLIGGLRGALRCLWLPVAAYAVWFLGIGRFNRPPVSASGVSDLPHFVATGLSAAVGGVANVRHATLVIVAVFLLAVLIDRFHAAGSPDRTGRILAAAGLVGAAAELVLTGLTRAGLGAAVNTSSRYSYVLIMLLFLCFARVVRRVTQWVCTLSRTARVPIAVVAAVAVLAAYVGVGATGLRFVRAFAENRVDFQRASRSQILGAMRLVDDRARLANTVASPTFAPIPIRSLRRVIGKFDVPSASANPAGVLNARGATQVVVSRDKDYYDGRYGPVRSLRGVNLSAPVPTAGHCMRLHVATRPGSMLIDVGSEGGMITMRTDGHYVDTRLVDGHRASRKQRWLFPKYRRLYIVSTASGMTLQVFLPAGHQVDVCR